MGSTQNNTIRDCTISSCTYVTKGGFSTSFNLLRTNSSKYVNLKQIKRITIPYAVVHCTHQSNPIQNTSDYSSNIRFTGPSHQDFLHFTYFIKNSALKHTRNYTERKSICIGLCKSARSYSILPMDKFITTTLDNQLIGIQSIYCLL